MNREQLIEHSQPFLAYLAEWKESLAPLPLKDLIADQPQRVALLCVDLINGFCYEGPLASPRVAALVAPIVKLFERAYQHGVRHFLLPQDTHAPEAIEFGAFPAHCVQGSHQSQTVPELQALPFAHLFNVIPKNSINSAIGTGLDNWLTQHPEVDTFITVGDCTDLCVYQLAMHLRLRANAIGRPARVLVPADCVDTYDLPVEAARNIHAMPHAADLLHYLFLYHMALNGVEIVATLS